MKNNEERSEIISVFVTPTVKKEFDMVKDNDKMKENILRHFLKGEEDWMKENLKDFDENIIRYQAGLVKIKDAFAEANSAYELKLEKLCDVVYKENRKLTSLLEEPMKQLESMSRRVTSLSESISQLSDKFDNNKLYQVERAIKLAEQIADLPKGTIEALTKLLKA